MILRLGMLMAVCVTLAACAAPEEEPMEPMMDDTKMEGGKL